MMMMLYIVRVNTIESSNASCNGVVVDPKLPLTSRLLITKHGEGHEAFDGCGSTLPDANSDKNTVCFPFAGGWGGGTIILRALAV